MISKSKKQAGSLNHKEVGFLRHNLEPEKTFEASEPLLSSGSCILSSPTNAEIVQKALLHFEKERYNLSAWCVMPNHVHVILSPLVEYSLSSILHSWKSFTSNKINKILGRTGVLWERESFDHLIRTTEHLDKFITYTEQNPVKAGFCKHPRDWPFSSCGAGFQPAPFQLTDQRKTPFVNPHNRGELPHLEKPGSTYFVTFCLADKASIKKDRVNTKNKAV